MPNVIERVLLRQGMTSDRCTVSDCIMVTPMDCAIWAQSDRYLALGGEIFGEIMELSLIHI